MVAAKETLNASSEVTLHVPGCEGAESGLTLYSGQVLTKILLTYDATASSCLFYLTSLPAAATGSRFRVNVAQSYLVYERVND